MKKSNMKMTEERINKIIREETRNVLTEAFKSNKLRQWFKMHGGVTKTFAEQGYPNMRVPQDGLGDVTDEQILFMEEFDDTREASEYMRKLKNRNGSRYRTDWDMRAFFTIYKAKDGKCLLVGLDRSQVETYPTWGGERLKKKASRYWRNEHLHDYTDREGNFDPNKQVYHYGKKAEDVGVRTDAGFRALKRDHDRLRGRMTPEEFNDYIEGENERVDSYWRRHYGKGMKSKDK